MRILKPTPTVTCLVKQGHTFSNRATPSQQGHTSPSKATPTPTEPHLPNKATPPPPRPHLLQQGHTFPTRPHLLFQGHAYFNKAMPTPTRSHLLQIGPHLLIVPLPGLNIYKPSQLPMQVNFRNHFTLKYNFFFKDVHTSQESSQEGQLPSSKVLRKGIFWGSWDG